MSELAAELSDVGVAQGLVVHPGDTLIVGFASRLTMQQVDQVTHRLGGRIPGVDVIVLDQVRQLAVYRPEGAAVHAAH